MRMQSMVWTTEPGVIWNEGDCLGLRRDSTYWQIENCKDTTKFAAACQNVADARIWRITGPLSSSEQAEKACNQLGRGMIFSIPATAFEIVLLLEALKSSTNNQIQRVLLNAEALVL
uniref:AlNc14C19G1974 protein n=1 Tax=Albugo laibachii Nc14 TaxID=890382 RepID=F0W503_9STRA|nr:AlNc14C19G1974 [Albugo laibachii Nc14]|eukprot:CCA16194.1 AlNc14C19G1974 [Albugo laibachii Nc14]